MLQEGMYKQIEQTGGFREKKQPAKTERWNNFFLKKFLKISLIWTVLILLRLTLQISLSRINFRLLKFQPAAVSVAFNFLNPMSNAAAKII